MKKLFAQNADIIISRFDEEEGYRFAASFGGEAGGPARGRGEVTVVIREWAGGGNQKHDIIKSAP